MGLNSFKKVCKWLWYHKNYIIIVGTPLVFLPLPLVHPYPVSVSEHLCALLLISYCSIVFTLNNDNLTKVQL